MAGPESVKFLRTSSIPISHDMLLQTRLPASWLERLLACVSELPFTEGEDAVALCLVQTVSRIALGAHVGVLYNIAGSQGTFAQSSHLRSVDAPPECDVRAIRVHQDGDSLRAVAAREETLGIRLFPDLSHELIVEASEVPGTTLHIAQENGEFLAEDSDYAELLQRAALVLGRGMLYAAKHRAALDAASELRLISAKLVQSEKLASLGQLAAGVVHELNNPLTSIVAYTDLLLKKFRTSGEAEDIERLERIRTSADRITHFSRELVTYARPSLQSPAVAVHLADVIGKALMFCDHLFTAASIAPSVETENDIPIVLGHPEQLTQVFVNLFVNAVQAQRSTEHPEVRVRLGVVGNVVAVRVDDRGPGIPEAERGRVFDPFFTTKPAGEGTGLGLTIVQGILADHKGAIRLIESERAACGASFLIELPVAK